MRKDEQLVAALVCIESGIEFELGLEGALLECLEAGDNIGSVDVSEIEEEHLAGKLGAPIHFAENRLNPLEVD